MLQDTSFTAATISVNQVQTTSSKSHKTENSHFLLMSPRTELLPASQTSTILDSCLLTDASKAYVQCWGYTVPMGRHPLNNIELPDRQIKQGWPLADTAKNPGFPLLSNSKCSNDDFSPHINYHEHCEEITIF